MDEKISYLAQFATPERYALFQKVLAQRTRYFTAVLEDIYQGHNASAVLRSADCFGIQDVYVVENQNEYKVNPEIALGASKWLDIHKYSQAEGGVTQTIADLRSKGYRIVATTPHTDDILLDDFDVTRGRAAFFFGTEQNGLSEAVMKQADEFVRIPMYGFTESFNVSVSAALVMRHITSQMRREKVAWQLTADEQHNLIFDWLRRSIRQSDLILEKYSSNKQRP
jgi:tRNA (guanosine-2'-O-)-methyltransferase